MAQDLILDRYEPVGTAGEGGFGTVQIAWDPRIQRRVAIKTIRLTELDAARAALPGAQAVAGTSGLDGDAEEPHPDVPTEQVTALAHLPGLDEARTAAMMADPRIVTVYDFEVRDRTAYLIMEYVEGITLTDLLIDYADYLTLDIIAAVFESVAGALEVAHESGVLHLDIKPDNILINAQGQVKVTDFGLATLADATGSGKTGGGTIGYMPPEQIRRESLDARADEWSLAAVSYEMLTGSNPFRVPELDDAVAAIVDAELVLPSLCWKDLDEQIDDVVFFALDPDREERYASVADFEEEMAKFLGDPESGTVQLQLVVEDALEQQFEADEADAVERERGRAGWAGRASQDDGPHLTLAERLLDVLDPDANTDEAAFASDAVEDADGDSQPEARPSREPLASRLPKPLVTFLGHAFGAVGSGFVAALALTNIEPLVEALGQGASYGIGIIVAIVAVLGAIRSHIGALVSFCMLAIALIICGHPIAGAVLLIASVAWWYSVGHDGIASANVALLLPLAGAFGGNTLVPLFSGAALRPSKAIVTTLFAIVLAVILAGFGTNNLLGWNVFANGDFGSAEVTGSVTHLLTRPSTWATVAGWMVATIILSLMRLRESRVLTVLGISIALVAVIVGSLVFSVPTPQLVISAIIGATVLVGVLV